MGITAAVAGIIEGVVGEAVATTIAAVAVGAAEGAAFGAGLAAITGGDIGNGAMFGAIGGGVTGGIGAMGDVAGASEAVGGAAGDVGQTGQLVVGGAADIGNGGIAMAPDPSLAVSGTPDIGAISGTTAPATSVSGTLTPAAATITGAPGTSAGAAVTGNSGLLSQGAAPLGSAPQALNATDTTGLGFGTGNSALQTAAANGTTISGGVTPATSLGTQPFSPMAASPQPSGGLGAADAAQGIASTPTPDASTIDSALGWIKKNPDAAQIGAKAVMGVGQGLLGQSQNADLIKAYTASADKQRSFIQGNYAPNPAGPQFTGLFSSPPQPTRAADPSLFTPSVNGGQWVYDPAQGKVVYKLNKGA